MTWGEILFKGQERLKNAGIAEYQLDAWYLFEHVFGISRARYFLCAKETAEVPEEKLSEFEAALSRRTGREPLQHILGTQEFMGLEFYVNRHVLIPRQDTETLVETVLAEHKEKNISLLDMCTGSGCIAISLKKFGGYGRVEAADISAEALSVAERNAERLLGERSGGFFCSGESFAAAPADCPAADNGRAAAPDVCSGEGTASAPGIWPGIRFRLSDMFSAFTPETDRFDVIVSNPPYIPSSVIEELEPEVRDFEPREALDGTDDGLFFYRLLARECGRFLREEGTVYFETGYDQGEAVCGLLRAHGFYDTRVIKDLAGKDRVVCGKWQTREAASGMA